MQYWGASGLGGDTELQGVICGGNPSSGGGWLAVMHEITHNYVSPQAAMAAPGSSNYFFGSHWGFSGTGTALVLSSIQEAKKSASTASSAFSL